MTAIQEVAKCLTCIKSKNFIKSKCSLCNAARKRNQTEIIQMLLLMVNEKSEINQALREQVSKLEGELAMPINYTVNNGRTVALTREQIQEIKIRYTCNESVYRIAKDMGLSRKQVTYVVKCSYTSMKNRDFVMSVKIDGIRLDEYQSTGVFRTIAEQ